MIKIIKANLFNKLDSTGLAVFRMFYMTILFLELLQLYKFRVVMYSRDSLLYFGEFNPEYIYKFWFIVVLFLFFGLFTRVSSIINYLFSVIIFSSAVAFEYHVFYAYVGLNFLLMFMPVSRVFSLDSIIFEKGIVPYLNYFKINNALDLTGGKFVFFVKEIEIPNDWEKDFLKRQMKKSWVKAGEYIPTGENMGFSWTDKMIGIFDAESR